MRFEGDKIWFDPRQDVGAEERRVGGYPPDQADPLPACEVFPCYFHKQKELLMERIDTSTPNVPGHAHDLGIVSAIINDFLEHHRDYFPEGY